MSPDEYKQQLQTDLGGATVVSPMAAQLAWDRFSNIDPNELRFLYAKLTLIDTLMGGVWQDIEIRSSAGEILHGEQLLDHLIAMRKIVAGTIEASSYAILVAVSSPDNEPAVEQLEAVYTLETPDGFLPDPNDPQYTADPIGLWRVS